MISLAGCDMVLGIQWSVILGSITWNFKVLTMEFTIAEKTILLQDLVARNLWEETELSEIKEGYTKRFLLQLLEDVVDTGTHFCCVGDPIFCSNRNLKLW